MNRPDSLGAFFAGVLLLFLPLTAQGSLMHFSLQDEAELGNKFYVLIHTYYPVISEPEINTYLDGVRDRLVKVMPPQPFPIKVELLLDNAINAFAAPAGHVFVNSGLILVLDSCDELAAVLAHEFSHVAERHIAHNIERSKYIGLGTIAGVLAGALIGAGSSAGGAVAVSSLAGAQAASLKFSRDNEREADQVGLHFLTAAGFSAQSMLDAMLVLKKQSLLSGSSTPPPYLLTHPGLLERIGYIQDRVQSLKAEEQLGAGKSCQKDKFYRVQSLVRARYTDPNQALMYYKSLQVPLSPLDHLALGIIYRRLNNVIKASEQFTLCQKELYEDYLWHREKGILYYSAGRIDRAVEELQTALRKKSEDFLARFYLGKCLDAQGRLPEAAQALKMILRTLPDDPDVHFALGHVLGKQGDLFQGYLEYALSYLYRGRFKQALLYQKRACRQARDDEQHAVCDDFLDKLRKRKELLKN